MISKGSANIGVYLGSTQSPNDLTSTLHLFCVALGHRCSRSKITVSACSRSKITVSACLRPKITVSACLRPKITVSACLRCHRAKTQSEMKCFDGMGSIETTPFMLLLSVSSRSQFLLPFHKGDVCGCSTCSHRGADLNDNLSHC